MKISESKAIAITQGIKVRKPCANCGYDGSTNGFLKVAELETSFLSTKEEGERSKSLFVIHSCPQCGYTTLINVDNLLE